MKLAGLLVAGLLLAGACTNEDGETRRQEQLRELGEKLEAEELEVDANPGPVASIVGDAKTSYDENTAEICRQWPEDYPTLCG